MLKKNCYNHWMKRPWLGILLLVLTGIGLVMAFPKSSIPPQVSPQKVSITPTLHPSQKGQSETLFVPYWGLDSNLSTTNYTQYVYFAVSPNSTGIDTTNDGYKDINTFVSDVPSSSQKLLAVSMVDGATNEQVMSSKILQQKVIADTVALAKKYGFDGVVLDLEYKALAFDEVVKNVSNFSGNFATEVKKNNLSYYQTLPGDTFYRGKPYDTGYIGKISDGVFIMAYDFHKASGNPGPNFPLVGEKNDYDLKAMTQDFLKNIPLDKITIVFGLFGYDWTIGMDGNSTGQANSLSLKDIQQKFLDECAFLHCHTGRDNASTEMKVTYTDANGDNHVIWYEDPQSIAEKKAYLKTQGITSTGLWAYSYF